jgi:hypothetical protein
VVTVACCYWSKNKYTAPNSTCFDPSWVDKLYRGFKRNLTKDFRFVVFTDREYQFCDGVEQQRLETEVPHFGCLIEPFKLNEPSIICGLDTIVLDNVNHLANYCEKNTKICAPRDPYKPEQLINPIVLVPRGHASVFELWRDENDMEWLRRFKWDAMDDLWPGQVISCKAAKVRDVGVGSAKIVYFHGVPKPHQLLNLDWVRKHWR